VAHNQERIRVCLRRLMAQGQLRCLRVWRARARDGSAIDRVCESHADRVRLVSSYFLWEQRMHQHAFARETAGVRRDADLRVRRPPSAATIRAAGVDPSTVYDRAVWRGGSGAGAGSDRADGAVGARDEADSGVGGRGGIASRGDGGVDGSGEETLEWKYLSPPALPLPSCAALRLPELGRGSIQPLEGEPALRTSAPASPWPSRSLEADEYERYLQLTRPCSPLVARAAPAADTDYAH
jgi:hypothetical protein